MRNDPEIAESLRFRQDERRCILNTFHALVSTPPTWKRSIYAWRDRSGTIRFTSGADQLPEGTSAGRAEGQMLIGMLVCSFDRPGALCVGHVLTVEQQATAGRAAYEIHLRNEREFREMERRAVRNLLCKEQAT